MLAPFQLSQPSLINWKQVFLGYTNKMYINPQDRTIFRTVEDEVEEMTRINRLICFNLDLKMDTIWLESLEAYYITYVSWLQVVNMNFEFGTQNVKSLSQKFSVTNPYENDAVSHSQIEIEIYWLKYNIACINFAKGDQIDSHIPFKEDSEVTRSNSSSGRLLLTSTDLIQLEPTTDTQTCTELVCA